VRIRLTHRLAETVNGLDLARRAVGDVFIVSRQDGEMMIREGWATAVDGERRKGDRRSAADLGKEAFDGRTTGSQSTRKPSVPRGRDR
jgi:endonuclease YncB( thermonuclease family)